jgi:hypothetical protein
MGHAAPNQVSKFTLVYGFVNKILGGKSLIGKNNFVQYSRKTIAQTATKSARVMYEHIPSMKSKFRTVGFFGCCSSTKLPI